MSFTGTPIIQQITPHFVRITGIALESEDSGTIGLFGATGAAPDITLPEAFLAPPVTFDGTEVPLAARIHVSFVPVSAGPLTNLPPSVAKTGTTVADFRTTLTNTNTSLASQSLEIYVVAITKGGRRTVNVGPNITVIGGDVDLG